MLTKAITNRKHNFVRNDKFIQLFSACLLSISTCIIEINSFRISPRMQVEEAQKRLNKWNDGKAPLLSAQE